MSYSSVISSPNKERSFVSLPIGRQTQEINIFPWQKRRTRIAFRDVDARQAAACRRQRARHFTSRGRSRCTRASRHDAPEEERKVPDPGNTSYDVLSTTRFFSLNCLQSVRQSQSQRLGNEINHTFNLGWRASCNFRSEVCCLRTSQSASRAQSSACSYRRSTSLTAVLEASTVLSLLGEPPVQV